MATKIFEMRDFKTMPNLLELKRERKEALDKGEAIIQAAERAGRAMTAEESQMCSRHLETVHRINPQIELIESKNTILQHVSKNGLLSLTGPGDRTEGRGFQKPQRQIFSEAYAHSFYEWLQSGGQKYSPALSEGSAGGPSGGYTVPVLSAALVEGTGSAGGFAVPTLTDTQIVPLAPSEMGVRKLATVIPTVNDIKIPQQATFSTSSAKAEGSSFTESEPTLSQVTLSAFMAGNLHNCSWELLQDVPAFQAFAVDDILLAQAAYEENLFVNGTGSAQAQGLIGNTGSGTGTPIEPDSNGNLVTINSTFDVMGTLNAMYHPGAAWLMQRATSIILRKAQQEANLFAPVFTRVGAQDYLHGYPLEYSTSMPSAARGHIPILFGDFKRGYVIGDRGGSGINVKFLDQPLASQGILQILAYRRMDGRVRRSEAIQQIQVALS